MDVSRPPVDLDTLRRRVLDGFETLSPRFQQIAQHLLDEPNDLAFETLGRVAERCGVQPSTIVRFAQSLGFEGAASMQRLLRESLLQQGSAVGYAERLRRFNHSLPGTSVGSAGQLLAEFVEGNVHALENLGQIVDDQDLARASVLLETAGTVFVLGTRRSFPVAAYFAYLLAQGDKRMVLIDGIAGLAALQLRAMTEDDLLVAISFQPYAAETLTVVEEAVARGSRVLAITDSAISPIGRDALLTLQVRETEVRGFRSIAASMALVQTLAIDLALQRAEAEPI